MWKGEGAFYPASNNVSGKFCVEHCDAAYRVFHSFLHFWHTPYLTTGPDYIMYCKTKKMIPVPMQYIATVYN